MIETQIIKEGSKPVAVVLDYEEYQRLLERDQDIEDYEIALQIERENNNWTSHEDLLKLLQND